VVVNINPLVRDEVPVTARGDPEPDQRDQLQRLAPAGIARHRLRAALLEDGTLQDGRMKRLRLHMIADDDLMRQLSVATKLVATPQVLHQLQVAGRAAAEAFARRAISAAIGTDSSVDLRMMFG
jgi:NTE family protein